MSTKAVAVKCAALNLKRGLCGIRTGIHRLNSSIDSWLSLFLSHAAKHCSTMSSICSRMRSFCAARSLSAGLIAFSPSAALSATTLSSEKDANAVLSCRSIADHSARMSV